MSSSSSSPNLDLHGIVRVADADGRKMTQVEEILTLEYLGDDTFKGLSLYSSYTRIFGE